MQTQNNTRRLYRWRSEALRDYARGQIIVIATSEEHARELAREAFGKRCDQDIIEQDLAEEPEVVDEGAVLIFGSA